VATLLIEHFGFSSSNLDRRAARWAGELAANALAGHTVWCATAWTTGHSEMKPRRLRQRPRDESDRAGEALGGNGAGEPGASQTRREAVAAR
jgi:hypothetical protein